MYGKYHHTTTNEVEIMHNNTSKNDVEVFIPTRNRDKKLQRMLDSLIECSAEFSAVTIIDNGNCDVALLDKYSQNYRIIYKRNPTNIGVFGSMDRILTLASQKYFVMYHDDDAAVPGSLSTQAKYLNSNPNVALVATDIEVFNEHNEIIPGSEVREERIVKFSKRKLITEFLKNGFVLPFPTIMYKRSILLETGFQFMSIFSGPCTDVLAWLKINCDYEVSFINNKLYRYFRPTIKNSVFEISSYGEYLVYQYDLLAGIQNNIGLEKGELKLLKRKAIGITVHNMRIIGDDTSLWSGFRSRILVNPKYRKLSKTIQILSCYRRFPKILLFIAQVFRKVKFAWRKLHR